MQTCPPGQLPARVCGCCRSSGLATSFRREGPLLCVGCVRAGRDLATWWSSSLHLSSPFLPWVSGLWLCVGTVLASSCSLSSSLPRTAPPQSPVHPIPLRHLLHRGPALTQGRFVSAGIRETVWDLCDVLHWRTWFERHRGIGLTSLMSHFGKIMNISLKEANFI